MITLLAAHTSFELVII